MADSDESIPRPDDPRYVVPPAVKSVAPAPRVNPPNIHGPKDTAPAGGPPGFLDFLEWMRSQPGRESATVPAGARTLIPKEKKKFQRRDAEAKTDAPVSPLPVSPAPSADASPVAEEKSVPVAAVLTPDVGKVFPTKLSPSPTEPRTPRMRRQQDATRRRPWIGLLMQLGLLILLAGSFVLGRITAPQVAAARVAPVAPVGVASDGTVTTHLLSDANAALIDEAMAAEQSGDLKKAEELLRKVKASGERVHGLTIELAQIAAFQKDYNRTLPLLNESISEGDSLGEAYNLRATFSNRGGLIRTVGMSEYETATKIEPFESRNFFYWGEALRRVGKDQAALMRLRQAYSRLREPALSSLYRLKIRLTQIEAGQEKEFADELEKQLAGPNPEMDWLITAAALEMHRGSFAAAAGFLDRAARRGDAESFVSRLRDYYLYQFKFEKELARFYSREPAARSGNTNGSSAPRDSPAPDASLPAIGLEMPPMPPAASPVPSLSN